MSQDRFALVREALALWRWSSPWRTKVLMTACLLTLRSLAALSSSWSMEAVKSTFTRCMGLRIAPELVKKRETSLPLSAMRAIVSAETGFFLRCVFFIKRMRHPAIDVLPNQAQFDGALGANPLVERERMFDLELAAPCCNILFDPLICKRIMPERLGEDAATAFIRDRIHVFHSNGPHENGANPPTLPGELLQLTNAGFVQAVPEKQRPAE